NPGWIHHAVTLHADCSTCLTVGFQYGKRLVGVESDSKTATAIFEDGTRATGRLLIGTEGAHSRVREYLLGEKGALHPSPIVATATVMRLPEDVVRSVRELHPRYCIAFHPDGYFMWLGSKSTVFFSGLM
ncbi:hypothetical protein T310_9902, partial [Rasamsonia emersonii CBS 393.64]